MTGLIPLRLAYRRIQNHEKNPPVREKSPVKMKRYASSRTGFPTPDDRSSWLDHRLGNPIQTRHSNQVGTSVTNNRIVRFHSPISQSDFTVRFHSPISQSDFTVRFHSPMRQRVSTNHNEIHCESLESQTQGLIFTRSRVKRSTTALSCAGSLTS
jgi:hypothetical protein